MFRCFSGGNHTRSGQEDRNLRPANGVGLEEERRFHRYHRVLSRASWSSREASRVLLGLLVERFSFRRVLWSSALTRRWRGAGGSGLLPRGSSASLGALQPLPLRQDQRPQMGVPDAARPAPVGRTNLGLAVSERSSLLRTLRQRAGQAAQEDNRVGLAVAPFGEALVSGTQDRGRRRRRIRLLEALGPLPEAQEAHHLRHPPSARRRPLRAGCATTPLSEREASPQRQAAAKPLGRR